MEKAKTDCHDEERDRSLFERLFESLKAYAASSEEPALSGQGVDSAPNSVFRTRGFAEIKIFRVLWLSESVQAL